MPAPGSLYGEGAGLLEAAGRQSSDIAAQRQKATDTTVQAGTAAGSEQGAERRQMSSQQAAMALKQMELNDTIAITPQIALGLAKNTGDKGWMEAVGQRMRPDVMLGLYTHSINQKRKPQITQIYSKDGTIQHALMIEDENGVPQQYILDQGANADKIHPDRRKGSGKGPENMDFKNRKEFLAQYNKRRAEYADPIKAREIQQSTPDKYAEDQQWLKDNQDQYDKVTKNMSKAGDTGEKPPVGGGDSGAPFDPDAFIRDALGDSGSRGGL